MDKFLLVDGNAVLHRAYYAMPDWRNRSGEATAGVYGFLSMLMRAIEELKPTHLAIVFDTPAPTFRHNMYVGYQSNREKDRQISEDIWGQVEKLKIVFEKVGVPVYTLEGFEADDVIGTLASQCEVLSAKCEVVIITGDKDLMQLVDDHIQLYMPQRGLSDNVLVDEEKVVEKLGVGPGLVIDYKALVGDSSDNYPGVTGIGPKTAINLLKEFGSFERIYKSLKTSPQPSPNLGEGVIRKLADGYEGGRISKELATIRRDAPITLDSAQCSIPSAQEFAQVFKELGYKSLVRRTTGEVVEIDKSQQKLFD